MPENLDESDFVDQDFHASQRGGAAASSNLSSASGQSQERRGERAPTREELDHQFTATQQKLAELRRTQEELERERGHLEESRRKQHEFQTGREEMVHNLTRGIEVLNEAELAARREAEQMAKTLTGLREALEKLHSIQEQEWSQENYETELSRALGTIENARMEWNAAQLKWPQLSGEPGTQGEGVGFREGDRSIQLNFLSEQGLGQLCKLGLALTWPLALVALLALSILLFILLVE